MHRALYLLSRLRPRFRGGMLAPERWTCRPHAAVPHIHRIMLLLAAEVEPAQVAVGHDQVGAPQRRQHNPKLPGCELRRRGLRHATGDENALVEPRTTAIDCA